jgi:predicted NUDIX family NTP pyrophosphohydrolase
VPKLSAGLLMFRRRDDRIEVLLVHPGGPFWAKKDLGAWSLPKGEYAEGEDPLAAARREFEEETGVRPEGEFLSLGQVRQAGGKVVSGWAFEGDLDPASLKSNTFTLEWPPKSGKMRDFPEVDRAGWFSIEESGEKILPGQVGLLEALVKITAR